MQKVVGSSPIIRSSKAPLPVGPEVAAYAARLGEYLRTKPEASVHVLRPLAAAYAQVVWFIFANADVPDGYLRVPDAEFPAELDERP